MTEFNNNDIIARIERLSVDTSLDADDWYFGNIDNEEELDFTDEDYGIIYNKDNPEPGHGKKLYQAKRQVLRQRPSNPSR